MYSAQQRWQLQLPIGHDGRKQVAAATLLLSPSQLSCFSVHGRLLPSCHADAKLVKSSCCKVLSRYMRQIINNVLKEASYFHVYHVITHSSIELHKQHRLVEGYKPAEKYRHGSAAAAAVHQTGSLVPHSMQSPRL